MIRNLFALAFALFAGAAIAQPASIRGARPAGLGELAQSFPNAQAITPRIWVPGIDEGWTPQGLAVMGKHALVSSYQDTDASAPKCRVFRIEMDTGAPAGSFDLPEPCRHAGGIVDIGGGFIVLADTRQDWRIDLAKALATGHAEGATHGMIKLPRGFGSAFTFFDGKDLWNGVFVTEKEADEAKIYRLDLGVFDRLDGKSIERETAHEIVKIPPLVQGAAIDRAGNLWLSASYGEKESRLYRVDRKTGAVLAQYDMPPRIENISFDAEGRLWAISESGSLKYRKDKVHFPLIFEIDVTKLR